MKSYNCIFTVNENYELEGASNILYSRGISYEQIKDWKRAEQDLKNL